MSAYEIIDGVCDSINPLLFLIALGCIVADWRNGSIRRARAAGWQLVVGLALVYGLLAADTMLGLWPAWEADYSTHTAFAVAAALPISLRRGTMVCLLAVLTLYAALMIYQRYHSLFDILTTAVALAVPGLLLRQWLVRTLVPPENHQLAEQSESTAGSP